MFLKPVPKFCYIFYFMHINEFFRFRLLVSNYLMQMQRAFISNREHLLLFAKIIVSVGKSKFLSLVLFSFWQFICYCFCSEIGEGGVRNAGICGVYGQR